MDLGDVGNVGAAALVPLVAPLKRQKPQRMGVLALLLASAIAARAGPARRFMFRCVILCMRAVTPLAFLVVARSAEASTRRLQSGTFINQTLKPLALQALKVWCLVEVGFVFYVMRYRQHLDSQGTRMWQAVVTHSTEEKRQQSMERYLLALQQVTKGGRSENSDSPLPLSSKRRASVAAPDIRVVTPGGSASTMEFKSATTRFQGFLKPAASANALQRSNSIQRIFSSSNLFSIDAKNGASVEDLLKTWENDEGAADSEHQKLMFIELSTWFIGPGRGNSEEPVSWLKRGNVEDWIAHYWFRGATPEQLSSTAREREELKKLVGMALQAAHLENLPEGRNEHIRPYRVYTDPLPVLHRPLALYVASSVLCPALVSKVMESFGFSRERVGGLCYWYRPPRNDVRPEEDIAGPSRLPLVFIHGLGIGLVPYFFFILRLSRRFSGDLYVPELPFLAMAPWESVPSPREVVAQLQDMLAANKHIAAHFAGHSFGAAVIGWLLKMSPSSVVCTTLMEPAMFLMMKSDVLTKVLFGPPKSCYEMFIRYFVFRELFTVNLLCRCYFWEQTTFWPEDLRCPAVVELASDDHIVQSLFVRRLLEHEKVARSKRRKERRKAIQHTGSSLDIRADPLQQTTDKLPNAEPIDVQWCEGFFHGEILGRVRSTERLFGRMRNMVVEAARGQSGKDLAGALNGHSKETASTVLSNGHAQSGPRSHRNGMA